MISLFMRYWTVSSETLLGLAFATFCISVLSSPPRAASGHLMVGGSCWWSPLKMTRSAFNMAAQQAGTEPKAKIEQTMGTNAKLEQAVNGSGRGLRAGSDAGAMPAAQRSTEAVATGGQRNTSINISLKSLVESMTFEGTAAQNAEQVERDMAQTLLRVLNMAASAAI